MMDRVAHAANPTIPWPAEPAETEWGTTNERGHSVASPLPARYGHGKKDRYPSHEKHSIVYMHLA